MVLLEVLLVLVYSHLLLLLLLWVVMKMTMKLKCQMMLMVKWHLYCLIEKVLIVRPFLAILLQAFPRDSLVDVMHLLAVKMKLMSRSSIHLLILYCVGGSLWQEYNYLEPSALSSSGVESLLLKIIVQDRTQRFLITLTRFKPSYTANSDAPIRLRGGC